MKVFTFFTAAVIFLFCGCAGSKKNTNKDNTFTKAFVAFEKDNTNNDAAKKAQEAYQAAKDIQLAAIGNLSGSSEETRWYGLVNAYSNLQQMYETVSGSACCSNKLIVQNYTEQLTQTREAAALYYYDKAETLTADTATENIRLAYHAYTKALGFVPAYRDAAERAQSLYTNNSFVVAFNPVEDSSFFAETVGSPKFYTYSNDVFISNLIRNLNTDKSSIPFLILLPYNECLTKNITPDWLVDITIFRLDIPVTSAMSTTYSYEKQDLGVDSTGKPIYRYVSVPYYNNCDVIENGQLELNVDITDASNGQAILTKAFDARLGSVRFSKCDGNINAIQSGNFSLRETAAGVLYANLYDSYKKSMKDLFEK
jgi:predicted component of type VI protein secretion system